MEVSTPSSAPTEPAWRSGLARLFERLATETPERAGAWRFGEGAAAGYVFLESGSICWAAAPGRRHRLTDLLAAAAGRTSSEVEAVWQRCRAQGRPLAESLVEAGVVDAATFRSVLLADTCESLVAIARAAPEPAVWSAHRGRGYSPALTLSPGEAWARALGVAAGLGSGDDGQVLDRVLRAGEPGVVLSLGVMTGWTAVFARGLASVADVERLAAWALAQVQGRAAGDGRASLHTGVADGLGEAMAWSARGRVCGALLR